MTQGQQMCGNCRMWRSFESTSGWGKCRLHPAQPVATERSGMIWTQPNMANTDWCSHWEMRLGEDGQ